MYKSHDLSKADKFEILKLHLIKKYFEIQGELLKSESKYFYSCIEDILENFDDGEELDYENSLNFFNWYFIYKQDMAVNNTIKTIQSIKQPSVSFNLYGWEEPTPINVTLCPKFNGRKRKLIVKTCKKFNFDLDSPEDNLRITLKNRCTLPVEFSLPYIENNIIFDDVEDRQLRKKLKKDICIIENGSLYEVNTKYPNFEDICASHALTFLEFLRELYVS